MLAKRQRVALLLSVQGQVTNQKRLHLEQKASSSARGRLTTTFQAKKHTLKNHVAWHEGRTKIQQDAATFSGRKLSPPVLEL